MPGPTPDGRPADLYEMRGRGGWVAQVLVDRATSIVYCAIAPVASVQGWTLEKLKEWVDKHEGWSLTHLGDGTNVKELKSK